MAPLPPIDDRDCLAARRRALLETAQRQGLTAIAVFGHGSALGTGTKSHGTLRFLSGWDGHESASLLLIAAEGAHLLVASPFMVPLARDLRPDLAIHDVRPDGWAATLAALLPAGGRIGIAGFGEMPLNIHRALGAFGGGVPLDAEIDRMRLAKDAAQERLHRAAAALCDDLFAALGAELSARLPAWQIQLNLEMRARRAGADYCRTWLTIAPQADYCRYWREEALAVPQAGDQVLLGIALTVDGHWGHGIRMGSIGPQKAEHSALAAHVEAMLAAGLSALAPGLPLAGVEAAMEAELARREVEAAFPALRRFRGGHGLGCSYEDPLLTDAFRQHFDPSAPPAVAPELTLAPGMLFELHPNLFVPGVGGAALGEMVLLTPHGAELLLRFPRSCVVWA
ncbi:aminopeptidase P family protein [Xanthobacter sp. DSM 24535]|uniref:M24 family metallopeptidase n=1 Tax=Roseixanthobacter psychrophilus TaxID=3119917 RepID=UPI00372CCFF2